MVRVPSIPLKGFTICEAFFTLWPFTFILYKAKSTKAIIKGFLKILPNVCYSIIMETASTHQERRPGR